MLIKNKRRRFMERTPRSNILVMLILDADKEQGLTLYGKNPPRSSILLMLILDADKEQETTVYGKNPQEVVFF